VKLIKIQIESLKLEQIQSIGASFINELKNILITFYSAKLVIDGSITLGMMLSITYISGQLNGPLTQFLSFIYSVQDAKISLERLAEIHNIKNEEDNFEILINELPENKNIELKDVSFSYAGFDSLILKNINLSIPENKITAIVGSSGSGKTTLMKLLLRFYEPTNGTINIDNLQINKFSQELWRENCGAVMQEGFIFNDTIASNIGVSDEYYNLEKLRKAASIANILEFIESLPLQFNTKIGPEGIGLSGGQKQRILIARSVYKSPRFLFFDEATSALDANNERIIMDNLNSFFLGKTAIIIAHRLSTVKNANQIVVLNNGEVAEVGNHIELIEKKGLYFNLVKNQLDLEKLESPNRL
jgi:ATP-binding cassette subfamily B protein